SVAGSTVQDRQLERDLGRPIRLVVAPRHPHRTASVLEAMQRVLQRERGSGHSVLRLTEQRLGGKGTSRAPWLVVDTIGELEKVYSLADVVFVGGTLARHGGHNMMEPAALGKPTVFGPHVWNFQLDVDLLLAGGGGILVEDPAGLRRELGALLADPAKCRTLVTRAKQVILQNQGATRGTLERLGPLLDRQAAG
ncbi:MAG: 3-deoxy-D-manno-octulosonic acid transferase, partial [Planctomycetota bacterium]